MKTWFPIVGAPAVWLLQTTLLWLVASWGCPQAGPTRTLAIAVSSVALVVTAVAWLAALSGWRHSGNRRPSEVSGWTRPDFAAAAAVLVSGAALLAVVAAALPPFMLDICQPMR